MGVTEEVGGGGAGFGVGVARGFRGWGGGVDGEPLACMSHEHEGRLASVFVLMLLLVPW